MRGWEAHAAQPHLLSMLAFSRKADLWGGRRALLLAGGRTKKHNYNDPSTLH